MKNNIFIYTIILGLMLIISCKKDEVKVTLNDNIAPIELSSLPASTFVLDANRSTDTMVNLTWNSPDYGYKAAINYKIQIDKKGNDFASAMEIASVDHKLTTAIIVGTFNKSLLTLGFTPGTAGEVQFRIKATINDSVPVIYSNIIDATITPFATSFPPIYEIGDNVGWNLLKAAVMESTAPSVYSVVVKIKNNNTFRFFTAASWTASQYNFDYFSGGTISALLTAANDNDKNFRFTGTDGFYEITVNLSTKIVEMVAVDAPVLFMVGDALGGWDWTANGKQLSWQSDGIFMDTVDVASGNFRFFKQNNWGPGYSYIDFIADSVSTLLANANDGDKNFKFIGTAAKYIITVNLKHQSVKMELAPTTVPDPTLYIIGSLTSWNTANAIKLTYVSAKIFTVTQTLTNGDIFRFFETADWSATQYNYTYFDAASMPTQFANGGGGDQNFQFNGTTGSYMITVDLTAKTITIEPHALYIVGDMTSWNLDNSIKMKWVDGGTYKSTLTFTNGQIFRFFETKDWAATVYNYAYFTTVDALFANGGGGDQNLKFTGTDGSYTITVDLTNKTVVMAQP